MEGTRGEKFPTERGRSVGRYYRAMEDGHHMDAYAELVGLAEDYVVTPYPKDRYPDMLSVQKGETKTRIKAPAFQTTQEIYNQIVDDSDFAVVIHDLLLSPAEVFATRRYEVYRHEGRLYYLEEDPEEKNSQVRLMESVRAVPLKEIVEAYWNLQTSPLTEEGQEMMRDAMEHFSVETEELGYFPFDVEDESGWDMYVDEPRDFGFVHHREKDRMVVMSNFQLQDVLARM